MEICPKCGLPDAACVCGDVRAGRAQRVFQIVFHDLQRQQQLGGAHLGPRLQRHPLPLAVDPRHGIDHLIGDPCGDVVAIVFVHAVQHQDTVALVRLPGVGI